METVHRKVNKRIKFIDHRGDPLQNSKIEIRQTNHSFLFGCGGFDFIPYVMKGEEEYRQVTESWLEIFNYATLPFYWGRYEPVEGEPDRDKLMKTARYLKDRGVKVKGHPLCWHTVCADWLMKYDNRTILEKQLGRIEREVSGFKGVIDMWDVINEVVIMPVFDKYDNAVTRICKEKGRVGLIREVFQRAHESNPDAILLLNDFNTSIDYEILIDGCLNAGVPLNAIGIQSHQHQGYWGKEKLLEVLERFSHFGLPLHFTENTLISGEIMPGHIVDLNDWQVEEWPTTPEGEERQAKEIEEMYRILFSHPLVEAITSWDYRDGAWLNAPSGFIRKDNSRKPSHDMLRRLLREEWWTDTSVTTDEKGWATVEAFKGDYHISSSCGSADVSLLNDDELVLAMKGGYRYEVS
ncbi:MAG: endo-1,4-beta-xylanase [Lachnospiraceae bacterium]|nr:endo-1,4-beta-xylanase [Lachnospiraceae bacterium]